jgi:CubicO group peptidase (beta-lactamase class C family)
MLKNDYKHTVIYTMLTTIIIVLIIFYFLCYFNKKSVNGGEDLTGPHKYIQYIDGKLTVINKIDTEKLDKKSELPIGSITKVFTSISMLILHQNKKLNIYGTVGEHLPDTPDEIKNIKLLDIINHTAGLVNMYKGFNYRGCDKEYTSATEIFNEFKNNGPLTNPSKTGIKLYSNIGCHILGTIIEHITNQPYYMYISNNITKPLKMTKTNHLLQANTKHYNIKDNNPLSQKLLNERSFAGPSGSLKSNISDMIKFANIPSLLNPEMKELLKKLDFCKIINDSDVKLAHTGGTHGGISGISYIYDKDWNIKSVYVYLSTGIPLREKTKN